MGPRAEVAIVTDSTSDIPAQEAHSLDILVIPALLTIEGRTYRDGRDISRAEFYRHLPQMAEPPTTAVPSLVQFERAYQKLIDSGYGKVLSIHLSRKLSGMVDVAKKAAQAFGEKVSIFDSGQVSMGLGFQVMEAAEAARSGLSLEGLLEVLRRVREQARLIAMINTQEYLKRSGRVDWVRAGLGDLLRIRLMVEVAEGAVQRRGLVRTRRKAIEKLISTATAWERLKRLAVVHTAVHEEALQLAERIRHLSPLPPMVVNATTLIGAHIGPASLGIAALCR